MEAHIKKKLTAEPLRVVNCNAVPKGATAHLGSDEIVKYAAFQQLIPDVLHAILTTYYMAHAVAFAAIRTTKTGEHFAESSYTTQL